MFSPTNGFDGPGQKPARGAISLLARFGLLEIMLGALEKAGPLWGSSTLMNFLNLFGDLAWDYYCP